MVAEPDVRAWGRWLDEHNRDRVLARTETEGGVVSTVFLGLDHNFNRVGPPILWETLILSGPHGGYMQRYSTDYAARAGHANVVRHLEAGDFVPYTDEGPEVIRIARRVAAERWGAPG